MRTVWFVAMLLIFSPSQASEVASQCGDIEKIKNAIADLTQDYGDVNVALKCKSTKDKAEQLICSDNHLFLMYKLDAMAEVYAIENATKVPLEHGTHKPTIPNCKDKRCLCNAFMESTNDSLGGESPYYVDK